MATPSESTAPIVREATARDAARLAELAGQLGYPSTPEQATRRLEKMKEDPRHIVLVAELAPGGAGGEVIGWLHIQECHLLESDMRAEISGLVVADGQRSRGVGRLLIQQAEQWARARGCQAVLLRSNVIRTRAHAFYQGLGYEVIKTQKVLRKIL